MRGRKYFELTYPLLFVLSLPLYLLPKVLVAQLWIFLDIFPGLLGVGFRYVFALRLANSVGKNVFIGRGVEVSGWGNLHLANNISIHKDCYLDATGGLNIGNDVSVAHSTSILTFEHTWDDLDEPIRSNPCILKSVEINDDVWIGCGCRILAGVTVGSRSVVAAGAVLITDVESRTVVGGVPAKKLKAI